MNYFSHWMLSGGDETLALGNFVGDFVKGKNYELYTPKIRKGIILHRYIDEHTDKHPAVKKSKSLFQPVYKKYAGVVSDIVYDYFLCENFELLFQTTVREQADRIYTVLQTNKHLLPENFNIVMERMIARDRLYSYSSLSGICEALNQMSHYTSLPLNSDEAIAITKTNYNQLNSHFLEVFEYLQKMANQFIERN